MASGGIRVVSGLPEGYFYEIPDWVEHFQWLAVVGSTKFLNSRWNKISYDLILNTIDRLGILDRSIGIVSGGAQGVDSLGEQLADSWWYRKCIFPPKNSRWEPEGFKERNELVAQVATWGLGIRCESSSSFGTGWTTQRIEQLGKPIERYLIHNNSGCTGCLSDKTWKVKCLGAKSV